MSITKRVIALGVAQKVSAVDTSDGLKMVFEAGDWFCIRLSGTENVARIYTETTEKKKQNFLCHICNALLDIDPEKGLFCLIQASSIQNKDQIPRINIYREIGFENENTRLGWVNPPVWEDVEIALSRFLSLDMVKDKIHFIFSGMGGSINAIKALIQIQTKQKKIRMYTIDSLDPAALEELFSLVDDLSKTLIIGISKSGTTNETQVLLKTLKEKFQSENLDCRNHFLWLTDLPMGKKNIEFSGWKDFDILPIQVDRGTDIGGRFTAPHTIIFLLPLLLLLDQDLNQLKIIWEEYLSLREKFIFESARKALESANKNVQYFAISLEENLARALETWIIQLFQESLGSKIIGFNPKTLVVFGKIPVEFEVIKFDTDLSNIIVKVMLNMYLLQIFVAIFAYYKRINFVIQPEVELYKKKMKSIPFLGIHQAETVTISKLINNAKLLQHNPQLKFLEIVCYWHQKKDQRDYFKQRLNEGFKDKDVFIFEGSDWNHHSYQAASWNKDTLFLILTKVDYKNQIDGISAHTLKENINALKAIAYATYETLKEKAGYFIFKLEGRN